MAAWSPRGVRLTPCMGLLPLGGRPAKQPGRGLRWGGGARARAGRPAGPPRFKEHAVSLTGPLRVVLDSLREVLVDGHGLLPSPSSGPGSWLAQPGPARG